MPGADKNTRHHNFCFLEFRSRLFQCFNFFTQSFFFFFSCTFGQKEESETIPYSHPPSLVVIQINKLSNREINKSTRKSDLKLKATIANFTYFWPWQVFAKWENKRLREPGKCGCLPMHSHNMTGDLNCKKRSNLKAERQMKRVQHKVIEKKV